MYKNIVNQKYDNFTDYHDENLTQKGQVPHIETHLKSLLNTKILQV